MFTIRQSSTAVPFVPVTLEDGTPIQSPIAVPHEDFAENAFGWPLNDIAALNGAKSLQEYELIASRMQEYQANNPDTSKMSVNDLIAAIEPRTFQTPAEVARFAEFYGRNLQDKVDAIVESKRQAAAAAAQKAAQASTPPPVTVTTTTT